MSDPSASKASAAGEPVWSGPTRTFAFPVELGPVLAMRRAIGERDDADAVPPTFASVVDLYDPDYVRRPPRNRGWNDGYPESLLHVEQRFDLLRPLQIGDRLTARRGPGRTWTKQGRTAGRLEFVEDRTELRDDTGALAAVVSWVDVRAEQTHTALTNRQVADRPAAAPGGEPAPPPDAHVVVERITRTQFVQYVAAVGDYHPLHHDEDLARADGYPSVFAPGMLTMGLSGRAVTDRFGYDGIRTFSGRFRAQVWPGDTLWATLQVVHDAGDDPAGGDPTGKDPDSDGATIAVTTRNQAGTIVFEGQVTYRPARAAPFAS